MTLSKVSVLPAVPSDFLTIAKLESVAFAKDEIFDLLFGLRRFSDEAIAQRAKSLAQPPKHGEVFRHVKAVTTLPNGTEEIVGFATWSFCTGRGGSEEEKSLLGTRESWAEPSGPIPSTRFYQDVYVRGYESMARAAEGHDYASKLC